MVTQDLLFAVSARRAGQGEVEVGQATLWMLATGRHYYHFFSTDRKTEVYFHFLFKP